jgi:predicted amidohydrolase
MNSLISLQLLSKLARRKIQAKSRIQSRQENGTISICYQTTIDKYAIANNHNKIHILKVDIQGSELTALKGAEVLVYPTAIGWDLEEKNNEINREQYQAWQTIQRSHSVANGIPVVSVNRVGVEHGQQFWGGSFVSNAFGRVIFQASHDQEEIAIVAVDVDSSEYYRKTWPFFRDRRIDSYGDITKRFND